MLLFWCGRDRIQDPSYCRRLAGLFLPDPHKIIYPVPSSAIHLLLDSCLMVYWLLMVTCELCVGSWLLHFSWCCPSQFFFKISSVKVYALLELPSLFSYIPRDIYFTNLHWFFQLFTSDWDIHGFLCSLWGHIGEDVSSKISLHTGWLSIQKQLPVFGLSSLPILFCLFLFTGAMIHQPWSTLSVLQFPPVL